MLAPHPEAPNAARGDGGTGPSANTGACETAHRGESESGSSCAVLVPLRPRAARRGGHEEGGASLRPSARASKGGTGSPSSTRAGGLREVRDAIPQAACNKCWRGLGPMARDGPWGPCKRFISESCSSSPQLPRDAVQRCWWYRMRREGRTEQLARACGTDRGQPPAQAEDCVRRPPARGRLHDATAAPSPGGLRSAGAGHGHEFARTGWYRGSGQNHHYQPCARCLLPYPALSLRGGGPCEEAEVLFPGAPVSPRPTRTRGCGHCGGSSWPAATPRRWWRSCSTRRPTCGVAVCD